MSRYENKKRGPSIVPRWSLAPYILLLAFSLILTQLLRSTVSSVLFWFLIIALPLSFIIMLIGKAAIQVYVMTDKTSTEKMASVEYEIRIINGTPIPYPFIEAIMSKPRDDGVRCLYQKLILSLVPFGGYSVKNTVSFRYRGLYEIGVHQIYVYDPLRLFRMRMDINNFSNVTVLPRKLDFEKEAESSVSDVPSPLVRTFDSRDRSEVSNIREYRIGDTLKSIHWKLSSKSEELQVKDYNTNNDRHTYVFVDLSAPTTCPEQKKEEARKKLKILAKLQKKEDDEGNPITLKTKIAAFREELEEKRRLRKYRRRRKKGNSARDIETIDMIDALIRETSGKGKKKAEKAEDASDIAKEEKISAKDMIDQLSLIVGEDTISLKEDELTRAKRAWGGIVKDEFEDELPEYCADGVIEIAVAAINSELRRGNHCTVIWFDQRSDSGMYTADISDSSALEDLYLKFASAPVSPEEKRITSLTGVIGDSINVTIKFITSNIDPASASEYSAVPAIFGGAGTGCVTEILLFNPADKYKNPKERLEYANNCRMEMKYTGINMIDVFEATQSDGKTVLICNELI